MDIIMAGDSLVEFFDWQGRFPAHRVANLGISGETVEGLLRRAGRITAEHPRADLVFVMSGINNLAMEDTGFLGAYGEILGAFSAAWQGAGIYVNSILPTVLPWISPRAIEKANGSLREIAARQGAGYLDIHGLFVKRGVRECLDMDGIHLSGVGYEVWAAELEGIIENRA